VREHDIEDHDVVGILHAEFEPAFAIISERHRVAVLLKHCREDA